MTFDLSEYVDVAERIREFHAKYPEGSLQSELTLVNGNGPQGWLCKAYAYRSASDDRPGIGHAFEPVPGKTPYTKDSEAMNSETSAWGRAIVALGFETKKIASAEEVRNRSEEPRPDGSLAGSSDNPAARAHAAQGANGERPSQVPVHFGKNAGKTLAELTPQQVSWYANKWELRPDAPAHDVRLKQAAQALHAGSDSPDFDLPFS